MQFVIIYRGGNGRFMVHVEKDTQVMIITIALSKERHSTLRCNLVSAQFARVHCLHILIIFENQYTNPNSVTCFG